MEEALLNGFSIVMATYNGERFLPEQLASLVRQTVVPSELIVVDDGSTDNTLRVVRQFAEQAPFPVRIYENLGHKGYVESFLQGLTYARGRYVGYCDQDDIWVETKLQTCEAYLQQPVVSLVIHAGQPVTENLTPLPGCFPDIRVTRVVPSGGFDISPLQSFPLGFALTFKREVAAAVTSGLNHYPSPYRELFGHEQPIVMTGKGLGSVAYVADRLVLYRRHSDNVTSGSGIIVKDAGTYVRQGATEYEDFAQHAATKAQFLEMLASGQPQGSPLATYFRAYQAYSERLSRSYRHRVSLYRATGSPVRRAAHIVKMVMDGDYMPRAKGGLGLRSFLKDVLSMVRG